MKRIGFVADSTNDLSKELQKRYDVEILPLHVHLGERECRDGVDISPEEIYTWSDANKATPKTAAVSITEAETCIREALTKAKKVIVFTVSESMSSCYSVMQMAVQMMDAQDKVFVIDSRNLSTGIGLQILEAARMAEAGLEAEEIVQKVLDLQPRVRASFVVDTLTYLHRGGRCSGLAAMAGGALKLHPYIGVTDGKMQPGKKYRGKMDKVIRDYVEDLRPALMKARKEDVFITHSGCDKKIVDEVLMMLYEMKHFEHIYETRAGSVISSHCGPGTLGVLFIAEDDKM